MNRSIVAPRVRRLLNKRFDAKKLMESFAVLRTLPNLQANFVTRTLKKEKDWSWVKLDNLTNPYNPARDDPFQFANNSQYQESLKDLKSINDNIKNLISHLGVDPDGNSDEIMLVAHDMAKKDYKRYITLAFLLGEYDVTKKFTVQRGNFGYYYLENISSQHSIVTKDHISTLEDLLHPLKNKLSGKQVHKVVGLDHCYDPINSNLGMPHAKTDEDGRLRMQIMTELKGIYKELSPGYAKRPTVAFDPSSNVQLTNDMLEIVRKVADRYNLPESSFLAISSNFRYKPMGSNKYIPEYYFSNDNVYADSETTGCFGLRNVMMVPYTINIGLINLYLVMMAYLRTTEGLWYDDDIKREMNRKYAYLDYDSFHVEMDITQFDRNCSYEHRDMLWTTIVRNFPEFLSPNYETFARNLLWLSYIIPNFMSQDQFRGGLELLPKNGNIFISGCKITTTTGTMYTDWAHAEFARRAGIVTRSDIRHGNRFGRHHLRIRGDDIKERYILREFQPSWFNLIKEVFKEFNLEVKAIPALRHLMTHSLGWLDLPVFGRVLGQQTLFNEKKKTDPYIQRIGLMARTKDVDKLSEFTNYLGPSLASYITSYVDPYYDMLRKTNLNTKDTIARNGKTVFENCIKANSTDKMAHISEYSSKLNLEDLADLAESERFSKTGQEINEVMESEVYWNLLLKNRMNLQGKVFDYVIKQSGIKLA